MIVVEAFAGTRGISVGVISCEASDTIVGVAINAKVGVGFEPAAKRASLLADAGVTVKDAEDEEVPFPKSMVRVYVVDAAFFSTGMGVCVVVADCLFTNKTTIPMMTAIINTPRIITGACFIH